MSEKCSHFEVMSFYWGNGLWIKCMDCNDEFKCTKEERK